jgi:pre-mRNA-processing factor 6
LAGAVQTCRAIVRNTVHLGVDAEDRLKTWMDDADGLLSHSPPAKESARAVYAYALEVFPTKKSLWQMAAMLVRACVHPCPFLR